MTFFLKAEFSGTLICRNVPELSPENPSKYVHENLNIMNATKNKLQHHVYYVL